MRPDTVLFLGSVGFVGGAILGGLGASPLLALIGCVCLIPFLFAWSRRWVVVCSAGILFLVGNIYYTFDDNTYQSALRVAENIASFEGRVVEEPRRSIETQTAKVLLQNVSDAPLRVYLRLDLYPELHYGDVVRVSGDIVLPPADSFGRYMAKEHVHGTLFYPEVEIVGNEANSLFRVLFSVRAAIKSKLTRLFPQEHAAFLSGILLGDKDEFSPAFLEKLSLSGTMHLMALSGLNMTIIVFVALGVFSVAFAGRKRPIFISSFSLVALFVMMTGFQVSAVRAALMAFLVGLAGMTSRLYKPHIAIAFAALVITLWNPKAPASDLGFQLSFLATLAIIYFTPVLKLLPLFHKDGTLGWRDALCITLAAQLGVAPITILSFENFSFTAFLANIGILAVIPLLTVLGFLVAFAAMVFMPLAVLLSKPIAFLIDYVMAVVDLFSVAYLPFNPHIGIIGSLIYYCVMLYICAKWYPKSPTTHEKT